jgi:menaquinone-dependent protoporphyrinogen oxidase
MSKFLIVYASKQGQTQKIALSISEHLKIHGCRSETFNIKDLPKNLELEDYNAIIIGASVHASGYSRKLYKWLKTNAKILSLKPTAFYSVCLGILQNEHKVSRAEQKIMEDLFKKTHWSPESSTIFAGALTYSKYNWLIKRVMRNIARKAGFETDMSKDYEYTDWNAVKHFTDRFSSIVPK